MYEDERVKAVIDVLISEFEINYETLAYIMHRDLYMLYSYTGVAVNVNIVYNNNNNLINSYLRYLLKV
ncbi:MAG: HTH domain-containing protein [Clostridium sp.]|uniref:HTH domain-containing protein n=1 Tax=Clostridium sp. TaxID=1506 RepID=UPI003D6CAF99